MPNQSFIARNKVKFRDNDVRWISIPQKAHNRKIKINEVKIIQDKWWQAAINKLSNYYCKAKYYHAIHPIIKQILLPHEEYLAEYNERIMIYICKIVDIKFSPVRLSDLNMEFESGVEGTDRLFVALCKKFGADSYYNFRSGVDEGIHKCENYAHHGIKLYKQTFNHPEYKQCGEKFISHMSILDALYNVGPEETQNLIIKGSGWELVQPL
jgi:hypothetical protein